MLGGFEFNDTLIPHYLTVFSQLEHLRGGNCLDPREFERSTSLGGSIELPHIGFNWIYLLIIGRQQRETNLLNELRVRLLLRMLLKKGLHSILANDPGRVGDTRIPQTGLNPPHEADFFRERTAQEVTIRPVVGNARLKPTRLGAQGGSNVPLELGDSDLRVGIRADEIPRGRFHGHLKLAENK